MGVGLCSCLVGRIVSCPLPSSSSMHVLVAYKYMVMTMLMAASVSCSEAVGEMWASLPETLFRHQEILIECLAGRMEAVSHHM